MQKVLFIVNGFGLGNSSRCDAIIALLLEKKINITILCAENSWKYFKERMHHLDVEVIPFRQLSYGRFRDKFSLFSTFLILPRNCLLLASNKYQLFRILYRTHFDAIVIDSDYTITLGKLFLKIPIIAINNSEFVIREMFRRQKMNFKIWPQFLIEVLDYAYHKMVPTVLIQPDMQSPLVRPGLVPTAPSKGIKNIVIMLGGSVLSKDITFLENLPDVGVRYYFFGEHVFKNPLIESVGRKLQNIDILNFADAFITNAGFSTMSECVYLRKPAVVVPVDHHAEQFINAKYFEEQGFGLYSSKKDIASSVYKMMDRWGVSGVELGERTLEDRALLSNGSVKAAKLIYEKIVPV
ncbi:MAG: hypothetical protein IT287_04280 [Bdellovibrionaceae bacterium]|nr:hypothetical protein [Pseudobdellovibrionaceae bacterium]